MTGVQTCALPIYKEWSLALDSFHKAIADEPNDHCAYFGGGVCHELIADHRLDLPRLSGKMSHESLAGLQTEYESALTSYRRACIILEEPPTRYAASRDRAEEKLGLVRKALEEQIQNNSPTH